MATHPDAFVTRPVTPDTVASTEEESIGTLFRRLGDSLATLFRKELALATSELSRSIAQMQAGIASLAAGGAVLFAGFIVLLVAASMALAQVVDTWLAFLIVGAIVTAVGFFMVSAGQKKLKNTSLKPERATEEVRQDAEMVRRKMQ
jgi:hypothetical protein